MGIDPGTTTAFAALDLKGRFVRVWSKRDVGKDELIKEISATGDPCVIATDVGLPPGLIIKVAAAFDARVFSPPRDMGEAEKKRLTRKYSFTNVHEMDAAAAALKAYHYFENKLRQTERSLRRMGVGEERIEEAKSLVTSGVSLKDVLEGWRKPLKEDKRERREEKAPKRYIHELERKNEKIRKLLKVNSELRKALERMERKIDDMKYRIGMMERGIYERIRRDSEIRKRDALISSLKYRIKSLLRRLGERELLKKGVEKNKIDVERIVEEYRKGRGKR